MAHHAEDYSELKAYWVDLSERVDLKTAWVGRHPDYLSDVYAVDEYLHEYGNRVDADPDWRSAQMTRWSTVPESDYGSSTFDSLDPQPNTSDLVRAETWTQMMNVALTAYETAITNAGYGVPL